MIKKINNMSQLAIALAPTIKCIVDSMGEQVYETLNYFLKEYYTEWTPSSYQRTMNFLYSAVKVDAKPYSNGYYAQYAATKLVIGYEKIPC